MNSGFWSGTWRVARTIFRQLHLWLGVGSALVLTIVCFSGALYVFNVEVKELLNREAFFVEARPGVKPPVEPLIESVEGYAGGKVVSVLVPDAGNRAWTFMVRREGERRGSAWMVNQYNGRITSSTELQGDAFFRTVIRLHRWLLLDREIGRPIVGWATIIMSILVISGLVIWLPRNVKYWYKGLKLKFSGSAKRLNYDLHRGLGFYAAILILLMTLTGPFWSFSWYRDGFFRVLGVERPVRAQQPPPADTISRPPAISGHVTLTPGVETDNGLPGSVSSVSGVLPLTYYLDVARYELPYRGVSRIIIPAAGATDITISRSRTGFFAYSGVDRVEIDMATAEVVKLDRFTDKPINEQIAGSVEALHTGEIFGLFTKILYFVAALIASMLPVTGVIIWINRVRGKRRA